MQQSSLSIEPLPQFVAQNIETAPVAQPSGPGQSAHPLCGAFDAATGFLLLGCSSGSVSCLHLGRYGSTARRILGSHAGRVTAACLFPWQAPDQPTDAAAGSTVVQSAGTASFFATCSADATIKLWTSDPKALHTTDACLQTLRGHKAAVTSLAAAQVAHTWCLLSGGADGQLLLWRSTSPADAADQQLSGAAMLAQLVPHMQITEAALYTSPHWILGITCPLIQTEVGATQGAFVVLAKQPLLQVPISRSAVADTATAIGASAAVAVQQLRRGSSSRYGSRGAALSGALGHTTLGPLTPSRLGCEASSVKLSGQHSSKAAGSSLQGHKQVSMVACAGTASNAICSSPSSALHRLQRPGSAGSSSYHSSSAGSPNAAAAATQVTEVASTQQLSILAAKFVWQQMAILTLSYDGACRLHSVVEGVTRCCWHSPTGTSYVAVDVCSGPHGQIVLLGDDKGSLHLYSLASEKLLATKQVASTRITAVISCDTSSSSSSSSSSQPGSMSPGSACSSKAGSCVQLAVLSEDAIGLWQLRQGFSHGIVPGGHRQAVIALQLCCTTLQWWARCQESSAQQQPEPPNVRKIGDTSSSTSSSGSTGHPGSPAQSSSIKRVYSRASSMKEATCKDGSNVIAAGGGCSQQGQAVGSMLMSAGHDGRVIQWDPTGGTPVAVQSILAAAGAEGGSELTAMAYLQGSSILATGHDNGQVLLWHVDTCSHILLGPQAHSNSVSCLAPVVTAKGDEQLLSAGFDGCVCLWEPRQIRGVKPHLLTRFQAHGPSPPGPKPLQPQQHHHHLQPLPADSTCSRPVSGSRAASRGPNRAVPLTQGRPAGPGPTPSCPAVTALSTAVKPASKAGVRAGSSTNRKLQLCASATATTASNGAHVSDTVNSSSSSGEQGGAALQALDAGAPEVLALLFEPLNQVIITGGNGALVKVWAGTASGVLLGQHVGHTGPVNCLALDGNLLFSGSHDTTIRMWDVLPGWFTGSQSAAFAAHEVACHAMPGAVSSAVGSPTSCSHGCKQPGRGGGGHGGGVASSTAFAVFRGHAAAVTGLAVAAESGVVVSCGADGHVLQWDYSTGQLLGKYSLEGQSLSCLAVGPDTKQLYVGTAQGQLMTVAGTDQVCAAANCS